ncbi:MULTISPECIES: hypothetical protein [Helicobacter]|uniref:Uncharacterized protein n=1 Tax=Helicobacter cinaedi CCUG 18818 = ATCC BAA-847 TaxID=537971 RepID=A0AAI8MN54_9HELI|nr:MULTISPECIES: hypothetical protein [Helicobacter]EFR47738.1 hypothetical protein HCCG_02287 [Helicobacter cinaedi CCUG 18818 = ATCC BAA-847]BAM32679.1 hypothetical protein HCBAA847_1449 [Helicobacter cinaedi CCUG 18818 = ATCC BAA-847]STP07452.1 Uncharacterised protein [Helicobacter fennelliae]
MLFIEGLASGIILFPYSLILYQLVVVGLLPFILISFVPKIRNMFLKKKSIRYWLLSGLLCYIVLTLIAYIMLYLSIREYVVFFMLSGVVFFTMYSSVYLLLLKFLSNKKQNDFLNKTEKYCILGLNFIFSLLFYAICRVILEYNLFSEVAKFFKEM